MGALVALYATLSVVLPVLGLWHAFRTGGRPAWTTGPVPAAAQVTRHRAPVERLYSDEEWAAMRMAAGGW